MQDQEEERAKTYRRQDIVVDCVEDILRNESKEQRHPQTQFEVLRRNCAGGQVAHPYDDCEQQSIQESNPIQGLKTRKSNVLPNLPPRTCQCVVKRRLGSLKIDLV